MVPKISSSIVVTPVGQELVVYDTKNQQAHCLNQVGMEVFKACQEQVTVEEAVSRLRALGLSDAEVIFEETVNLLAEKGVLVTDVDRSFDRRRFLAAAGAAVTIPVVLSALAPQPAQAVSCVDCQVNAGLQPTSCTTCGNNCPGTGCTSTARCCFEYRVNQNNPVGVGACNGGTGGTGGPEGTGIYTCRTIPVGSVFNTSCDAARNDTITAAGSLAAANARLYYCCVCTGANPIFTC